MPSVTSISWSEARSSCEYDRTAATSAEIRVVESLASSSNAASSRCRNARSGYSLTRACMIASECSVASSDVRREQQKWPEALNSYRAALAIIESLAAHNADKIAWQRDLWTCFSKIADVQVSTGSHDEALATYRRALTAIQQLVTRSPDDPVLQSDLAFTYSRIGIAQGGARRHAEALEDYRRALTINERLAAAEPNNTNRQRDLFLSFTRGGRADRLGDRDEAIATCRTAIALMERLAPTDPGNAR